MISMVIPLSAGNALKVFLMPPADAQKWRVLRKESDTFTDQNDATAFNAYEGTETYFVDSSGLQNGVPEFYQAFYWNGTAWSGSTPNSGTPTATYGDRSTDPLSFLRDRLEAGLAVEVARGALLPASGVIEVVNASPQYEPARWPIVSVILVAENPVERAIGELYEADSFDSESGLWTESEGWLSHVQINVSGWTENSDERIELRKALRRIVIANLPVFDAQGFAQIEFPQNDMDMVGGEYPAPVYQTSGTFTCLAPVIVGDSVDVITDVEVTGTETDSQLSETII
jgi:hypothetical protein